MASRIRREDTHQQEETNSINNPSRRNPQQEENQGFKTPAEKTLKASRHQPRRIYSKKLKKKQQEGDTA